MTSPAAATRPERWGRPTTTSSHRAWPAGTVPRRRAAASAGPEKFHFFHASVTDTAHVPRYRLGWGGWIPPGGWGADRRVWRSIAVALVRRRLEHDEGGR